MTDAPPEPQGGTPRARAAGAAVIGVGLHPLALAAYEWVHLGRSPRLGLLATAALGLDAARHLARLADTQGAVHPMWWTGAGAALTAWWILGAYPAPGEDRPLVHWRGLPAAAVTGLVIWAIRQLPTG